MIRRTGARSCARGLLAAVVVTFAAVTTAALGQGSAARSDLPAGRWQDASTSTYRNHLIALRALTETCAKARDLKSCDPTLIGPDDRVPVSREAGGEAGEQADGDRRMVRFGWLRVLFSHAEEADTASEAPDAMKTGRSRQAIAQPAKLTTSQLLVEAEKRLDGDLAQAGEAAAVLPAHPQERDAMKQVLAGREFRNLQQAPEGDTVMERFGNWLNHVFAGFGKVRARSAWVGRALVWGFFLAVAVVLAWGLVRMERRWRVRLVPLGDGPAPEAASARDWQLWLADARKAAAAGDWRAAIHFVYWASISRLESTRLWPADRARTPREYLALVAPEDPRMAGLASLTGAFERTWYGGREAGEEDYRRAEQLSSALIAGKAGLAPESDLPRAAEGGGR